MNRCGACNGVLLLINAEAMGAMYVCSDCGKEVEVHY